MLPSKERKNTKFLRYDSLYSGKSTDKKFTASAHSNNYFLTDPDLWRDTLPQPYRMLDKILNDLLETVWSAIQHRRNVKQSQRCSNLKDTCTSPFSCTSNQTIQVPQINSCSGCNGSMYLSLGTKDGLYILDGSTQDICATWKLENSEIKSVNQYFLDTQSCIMTTLDDVGTARVFLFSAPNILILTFSIPDQNEVKPQSFVTYCAASPQADYFGAVIDGSATGKESQLEIYKLSFSALFEQFMEPKLSLNQIANGTPSGNERQVATLFLRIPNISTPQGCRSTSLYQACKLVDNTGEVIGYGNTHILSKNYFEARTSTFQSLYPDMMKYLPEKESLPRALNFKFIQQDPAMESNVFNETTPPALLVWSTNTHILSRYSLVKLKKDSEFPDPDIVWPFAAAIKIVAISLHATWIAIGLENGFVIIWDYQLGISFGVFDLSPEGSFKDLHFLSINSPLNNEQQYSISCHLIAVLNTGMVQHISFLDGSFTITTLLSASKFPEATLNKVMPISGKNELLLMTFNNGVILLSEVINGQTLCEMKLPPTYTPLPVWEPIVAIVQIKPNPLEGDAMSSEFTYVYINGSLGDADEVCTDENNYFLIFQLDTIPVLETYYKETDSHMANSSVVENSLESILENSLKNRKEQQRQRNIRLKSQWAKLPSLIPQQNVFN